METKTTRYLPDTPQSRLAIIALMKATAHLPPVNRKEKRVSPYPCEVVVNNERNAA